MSALPRRGRALLKSRGISQWQTGSYPDRPLFEQDVQEGIGYVVCEEGRGGSHLRLADNA